MSTHPPTPSPVPSTRTARTPLVVLAIVGASVVAAGVGGYVAQSQRQVEMPRLEAHAAVPAPSAAPRAASAGVPATPPAAEAAVAAPSTVEIPASALPAVAEASVARDAPAATISPEPVEQPSRATKPIDPLAARKRAGVRTSSPAIRPQAQVQPALPAGRTAEPAPAVEMTLPEPPAVAEAVPPAPIEPVARPPAARVSIAETFLVPADSVIGLEIEQSVSSETAQPEDRVDARVTRDVKVDGTIVIPAGSRVRGAVTRVENGGRFKERGRIEIRFHTLVLADGDTQTIATDTLFREGDNVGRKASARIGASAAGGAIIGAIFGGEKGAAIGAAAGAGAGTAVTASQKPSEARFRAGSVVTVRLTAPVSITVQQ
ncbi:MAG: hypothetical protein ABIT71_24555 [Vicinamibacteraceae bacterium]